MADIMDEYNKAMAVLNELSSDYLVWVQADLKNLENIFEQAKTATGEQRTHLISEDLFRIVHDMKGQGATFGYELITDIGNHLCRYIERFNEFEDAQIADIAVHINALRLIIDEKLINDGGEKGSLLKQKVEAL
jgi:chemotaxis protein histidine kinase CheA